MNTYKTIDVARMIGIHVNTVRLYEACNLIPKPERYNNGYRIFTDLHIEQFRLARAALQVEVLQNGLRKQIINIIKVSAIGKYDDAILLTKKYLHQINIEKRNAEEAIDIAKQILSDIYTKQNSSYAVYTRKEVLEYLQITLDTLRNWELNGLLREKRKQNGHRIYTQKDIQQLKMIRSLRCANYSLSSILRMLQAISYNPNINIRDAIDTPKDDDDIITACDNLLTSLTKASENALFVITQIKKMKQMTQ